MGTKGDAKIVKTKQRRVSDVPITFARAAPMTRLNRAREVNPLCLEEGNETRRGGSDDARWKFAFPAVPESLHVARYVQ